MNEKETAAMKLLANHPDAGVREAGNILNASDIRRRKILGLIKTAIGQLRLDMKYIQFDLEATRRERDAALKGTV
jgi:hypothetical protein